MGILKPTLTTLAFAACLVLALSLSTASVLANGVAVSIDAPDEVAEGGNFTIYIEVDYVIDISAGQFMISYDNTVIELTDPENFTGIRKGDIWGPASIVVMADTCGPGCVQGLFYDAKAGATTGSGTLIEIGFDVLGTAGETSVLDLQSHITFNNISDDYGYDIPSTWGDGSVHVTSSTMPTPNGTPSPTDTPAPTATPTPNGTPSPTDTPTPPDVNGGLLWWHYLLIGLGALVVLVFIVMLFSRRTIS